MNYLLLVALSLLGVSDEDARPCALKRPIEIGTYAAPLRDLASAIELRDSLMKPLGLRFERYHDITVGQERERETVRDLAGVYSIWSRGGLAVQVTHPPRAEAAPYWEWTVAVGAKFVTYAGPGEAPAIEDGMFLDPGDGVRVATSPLSGALSYDGGSFGLLFRNHSWADWFTIYGGRVEPIARESVDGINCLVVLFDANGKARADSATLSSCPMLVWFDDRCALLPVRLLQLRPDEDDDIRDVVRTAIDQPGGLTATLEQAGRVFAEISWDGELCVEGGVRVRRSSRCRFVEGIPVPGNFEDGKSRTLHSLQYRIAGSESPTGTDWLRLLHAPPVRYPVKVFDEDSKYTRYWQAAGVDLPGGGQSFLYARSQRRLRAKSAIERLCLPVRGEFQRSSCGPNAALALCHWRGASAVSLKSILDSFPASEVKSRETSLKSLADAVNHAGLRVRALRCEWAALRESLPLGVIVHLRSDPTSDGSSERPHFALALPGEAKSEQGSVLLFSPPASVIELSAEDFRAQWTGIACW